jgi:type III secretion protein J
MIRLILMIALGLMVAGCKETVNAGLAEREANEIIATLYLQDIAATKVPAKEGLFSVTVRKADFGAAIAVLSRAGLPRETFNSMGDVFPDDSVVGTPFEENARYAFALGQELSRTISEIKGVHYARVHVVVPEKGRFEDAPPPAKAAIALYHSSEFDPAQTLPQIKQLAAFAVPNLTYEAVSVSLFPASALGEVVLQPVDPVGLGGAAGATSLASFGLPQGDLAVLLALSVGVLFGAITILKLVQLVWSVAGRLFANGR